VSIILIGHAFSQEPQKSNWSQRGGPKFLNQPHLSKYGYDIRFIFAYRSIGNWRNRWDVGNFCSNYIKSSKWTHSVEDWRWANLPKDETGILILGFYNTSGENLAWVAVKNYYDGLYITSDQRSNWNRMEDYPNSEISFQWISTGIKIKISVRDPYNQNGWTENDIWYKFSY